MKKKNLFKSTAIMCALLCLAFTFDNNGIYWFWSNSMPVAIILAIGAIVLGIFWLREAGKIKSVQ